MLERIEKKGVGAWEGAGERENSVTALHGGPDHLFEDIVTPHGQVPYTGEVRDLERLGLRQFPGDINCTAYKSTKAEELVAWQKNFNHKFKPFKGRCPVRFLAYWRPDGRKGRLDDDGFVEYTEELKGPVFRSDDRELKIFNGCSLLVVLPGEWMFYHHDYSYAHKILYDMYKSHTQNEIPTAVQDLFAAAPAAVNVRDEEEEDTKLSSKNLDPFPFRDRLIVVAHHRLGDVYRSVKRHIRNDNGLGRWFDKLMPPGWILLMLYVAEGIVGNQRSGDCFSFHVFSDAQAKHPHIMYLRQGVQDKNVPFIAHGNKDANARTAFDAMVHADLLIVGTSGFGRVAAAFNDGVTVAPRLEFHNLLGIPKTIVVDAVEELKHFNDLEPIDRIHALSRANLGFIKILRDRMRKELYRTAMEKGGRALAERCGLSSPTG